MVHYALATFRRNTKQTFARVCGRQGWTIVAKHINHDGAPFNLLKGGEDMESVYLHHLTEMQRREREILDDHEERLRDLENERIETNRRFDTLSKLVEEHEKSINEIQDGFVKYENTMLKEFRETREESRESRRFLEQLIQGGKESEVAAAESERETKRTKLQITRDIVLSVVGLWIAYQEFLAQIVTEWFK